MDPVSTPAEKFAAAKSRSKHAVTEEFLAESKFPFDDFQIQACHAVES